MSIILRQGAKTPPAFDHQKQCFEKLKNLNAAGIFGEQGTGKTRMAIDLVSEHYRNGKINAVLLIAPKGVHEQWHSEQVGTHCAVPTFQFLWRSTTSKAHQRDLMKFVSYPQNKYLKWLFVNVDAFSKEERAFKTDARTSLLLEYVQNHDCAIIIDESTRIKNPESNRAYNICYGLCQLKKQGRRVVDVIPYSKYRFILTGMQVTNSPYDLWSQFEFLRHAYFKRSFYAFKKYYGIEIMDSVPGTGQTYSRRLTPKEIERVKNYARQGNTPEQISNLLGIGEENAAYILKHPDLVLPYKNLDELKKSIETVSFTVSKKDCLDLPEKIYSVTTVEMSSVQKRLYTDLRKRMMTVYEGKELTVLNTLSLITRLQQVTAGFFPETVQEGEEFTESPQAVPISGKNPKIEALKREIEELGNVSIFVACKFTAEIEMAKKELMLSFPDKEVAAYYGAVSSEDRADISRRFKNGDIDILLINMRMAIGLNFQANCHNAIALSSSYSLEDRKQWEDRIHRIGQKNRPLYRDIVIRGTIDEKIHEALKAKENLLNFFRSQNLAKLL